MSMELIEPAKLKTQIYNLTAEYDTETVHIDALIDLIDNQPTVKAIPKADYETRLKADMVAILEQLDAEIQEQISFMGDGEEANGMKRADNLIKDKINDLKQSIWQEYYNGPKEVE